MSDQYYKDTIIDIPINENNPAAHFQYTYPYNFQTIAAAFLRKYNYEPRIHLTTVAKVE